MIVGMGTVFVFLAMLVLAMLTMSAIAIRFSSEASGDGASDEEVAAISAAIAQHRKR